MIRTLTIVTLAASLAGCSTISGLTTTTPTQIQADLANFELAVQKAAVLACGVEPTAQSVAALLTAGNAIAAAADATAGTVASLICTAVTSSAASTTAAHRFGVTIAPIPAPVVIGGVTVHFESVKAALRAPQ